MNPSYSTIDSSFYSFYRTPPNASFALKIHNEYQANYGCNCGAMSDIFQSIRQSPLGHLAPIGEKRLWQHCHFRNLNGGKVAHTPQCVEQFLFY